MQNPEGIADGTSPESNKSKSNFTGFSDATFRFYIRAPILTKLITSRNHHLK